MNTVLKYVIWVWSSKLSCKISRRHDQPSSRKWRLKLLFLVIFRIFWNNWNCQSMCRHMYDWNIVDCDVKKPIHPIRKIRTSVASMHTRAFAHLPIVLYCYDVIIFLGRKAAQIENNGLGRWLNANPYGQSVIRIFRILSGIQTGTFGLDQKDKM